MLIALCPGHKTRFVTRRSRRFSMRDLTSRLAWRMEKPVIAAIHSYATLACFPNMLALERMARKTRPSASETWTRRKILARIESRMWTCLPGGVFAQRGSQNLLRESLAVPLKTCRLLYTQSLTQKTAIVRSLDILPAVGCFLPVAEQ